jgi:hypothetical protein
MLEKKMKEIGDSVKQVDDLIQEFDEFETKAKVSNPCCEKKIQKQPPKQQDKLNEVIMMPKKSLLLVFFSSCHHCNLSPPYSTVLIKS